jgi:hypothetical protein
MNVEQGISNVEVSTLTGFLVSHGPSLFEIPCSTFDIPESVNGAPHRIPPLLSPPW